MIRLLRYKVLKLLSASVLLIQANLAGAQQNPVEELIDAFPNSSIVSSSVTPNTIHQVALGILQNDGPEAVRRVTGVLSKTLYEIPSEYSGEDVYRFFQNQFEGNSFELLFSCVGRSCGSSSGWANDVFKNRILYGPVQNQFYLAYQTSAGGGTSSYVTVYIITRGNRRLYAYVEITEPTDTLQSFPTTNQRNLAQEITEKGFSTLRDIQFQGNEVIESDQIDTLIAVLNENPLLEIYIVSHLADDMSLSELQERTQKRAEIIMRRLIESGISSSRLSSHGVGPLAPSCVSTACQNRIDIVRRQLLD
jgi:outer membrane protein OmpA-like peptidoglycan-associated protein